jgi:hypothetical protein
MGLWGEEEAVAATFADIDALAEAAASPTAPMPAAGCAVRAVGRGRPARSDALDSFHGLVREIRARPAPRKAPVAPTGAGRAPCARPRHKRGGRGLTRRRRCVRGQETEHRRAPRSRAFDDHCHPDRFGLLLTTWSLVVPCLVDIAPRTPTCAWVSPAS